MLAYVNCLKWIFYSVILGFLVTVVSSCSHVSPAQIQVLVCLSFFEVFFCASPFLLNLRLLKKIIAPFGLAYQFFFIYQLVDSQRNLQMLHNSIFTVE